MDEKCNIKILFHRQDPELPEYDIYLITGNGTLSIEEAAEYVTDGNYNGNYSDIKAAAYSLKLDHFIALLLIPRNTTQ